MRFEDAGAPAPSVPRQRGTPRAGNLLNRSRWTLQGFGLRAARLDPVSCPCGPGARGFTPRAEPPRWGATPTTATGLHPACGFSTAPPGDVLTVWAPCSVSGGGWTPCPAVPLRCRAAPTPPPCLRHRGCAPIGLPQQPARTDSLRQTMQASSRDGVTETQTGSRGDQPREPEGDG